MKDWTILVYLAGDNNLEAAGVQDLVEMKTIGSTAAVNVAAQFDRMGDGLTRRYYLTRDASLDADGVASLAETNTGDPANLLDFVRWGLAAYPARRAALILWNHGAGWKDDDIYARAREACGSDAGAPDSPVRGLRRRAASRSLFVSSVVTLLQYPPSVRAILFDDTSKDFLDNQELKLVLDALLSSGRRKLDLIGFDACLMSMIEVAAQVHHACDVMVGSQEAEPADGWPYDEILGRLAASPGVDAVGLGRIIAQAYGDHYTAQPASIGVTQSALRLRRAPELIAAIDSLAHALLRQMAAPGFVSRTLLPAVRAVHKFRDQQYVDLGHLVQLLLATASDPDLVEALQAVAAVLDGAVGGMVAAKCSAAPRAGQTTPIKDAVAVSSPTAGPARGDSAADSHGVSIYLPLLGPVSPAYTRLEFARQCAWAAFLDQFAKS